MKIAALRDVVEGGDERRVAVTPESVAKLIALGAAVASGMLIGGGGTSDSLALGLATALTGLVFGAVTAVTAQLTEHAGTASGTALGILALAFMVRGIGDVIERDGSWLSWFSPLAWAQQTRAFVDLRWWPLLVSLAAVAVPWALAAAVTALIVASAA